MKIQTMAKNMMGKFRSLRGKRWMSALTIGALTLTSAIVQDAQAQEAERIYQSISATDVADIFKELQITTQMRQQGALPGNGSASPIMMASTPGGGKFLVIFQQCANPAEAAGCRQTTISTAQAGTNLVFDDLNHFNGGSSVTTAVYDAANQLLVFGRNIFVPGGVGRENYKLQTLLFLNDMARFANGRSGSATSVSFTPPPALSQRLRDAGIATRGHEAGQASLELEVAIANAAGVTFDVDDQ